MKSFPIAIALLFCVVGTAYAQSTPSDTQEGPPRGSVSSPDMNSPPAKSSEGAEMNSPVSKTGSVGKEDQEFFRKAAAASLAELQAAKVAQQQGTNSAVKSFSQQMVTDHTQVDEALGQLAQSKGVSVPDSADPKEQKAIDKLQQKKGAAFDKAYADAQVKGHEAAVALFKKATKSKDPDIAAFAKKTLPTLEEHLASAKAMKKEVS